MNSCPAPGKDHLCLTGGLIACLSFFNCLDCCAPNGGGVSPITAPANALGSLGARKLAIVPNAFGGCATEKSVPEGVRPNTACTSQTMCKENKWVKKKYNARHSNEAT